MKVSVFALVILMLAQQAFGGEIVVFVRDQCPPCALFKSDLEKDPSMASGHRIVFAEADSELWGRLGVKTTPTFMLFDDAGGVVKSKAGYRNKREFVRWLMK